MSILERIKRALTFPRMKQKQNLAKAADVGAMIHFLRGQKVMLDSDLGVETKNLNKAVSRNRDRFPSDFTHCLPNIRNRNNFCPSRHHP